MKLRNFFMILLLCMAVGVFGVSCTGDDGKTGPAGPQGPAGDPGLTEDRVNDLIDDRVDDLDPGGTNFYAFLKSWGSTTGEVGCNDPILTDEGPLPGPSLTQLTETELKETVNGAVAVSCSANNLFAAFTRDLDGDGTDDVTAKLGEIILTKTGRAEKESDPVRKAADDFGPATETVTKETFVEGLVFAQMMNNGPDEPFERGLLYSDCGVGTDPPAIAGKWKAVQKTQSDKIYTEGVAGTPTKRVGLTKVCVVLDAHPGVTKCFVDQFDKLADDGMTEERTKSIALYDGENLDTVIDEDDLSAPTSANATLFATDDFSDVEQICNFFSSE